MKILAFSSNPLPGWWRLESPAKWINRKTSHQMRVYYGKKRTWLSQVKRVDLVVGQTFVSPALVDALHALGIKVIYEIDDAFLVYKKESLRPSVAKLIGHLPRKAFKETVRKCDALTVSTESLKRRFARFYQGPIYVLPNYMDFEWWGPPLKIKKKRKEVRIGWFGSVTHYENVEKILKPVILKVLAQHDNVFFILNSLAKKILEKETYPKKKVKFLDSVPIAQWPAMAKKMEPDIGLAPLLDDYFNQCRSPLKYFEFGGNKVAGVYSPTVYQKLVKHEETGFIAGSVRDWVKFLSLLIESQQLRIDVGGRAYKDVKRNYDLKDHFQERVKVYQEVLKTG